MLAARLRSPVWLDLGVAALTLGIFVLDTFTPLGFADWALYVVPLAATSLGRRPSAPLVTVGAILVLLYFGYVLSPPAAIGGFYAKTNRLIAATAAMVAAGMSFLVIRARIAEIRRGWVRDTTAAVRNALQGDKGPDRLAHDALAALLAHVEAPAGVVWTLDEHGKATRRASTGIVGGKTELEPGEGLVGRAVEARAPLVVDSVPASYIQVGSGLGQHDVAHVVVAPALVDDRAWAAVELGAFRPVGHAAEVLELVAEPLAVALRTAELRAREQKLLEETTRQAAELQAQQEELRAANEELESQSESLREAQAELEATNAELEQQQHTLSEQNADLLRAQDEVRQRADELAVTSRYKSEFLANMSHELRTPLNSALILAKLLADNKDGNLTPDQIKFARTIHDAGSDLLLLINDILDLSRIEAGKLQVRREPVSIPRLVSSLEAAFRPLADDRKLGLRFEVDADVPETLESDGQRVGQVVKNLLSNAVKFTDRGEVRLHVSRREKRLAFAVHDTGIGISKEDQAVVFEAFRQLDGASTRKQGGSGLGLAISHDLARLLGGDIELESEKGKGSTFTFLVPLTAPATVPAPARSTAQARITTEKRATAPRPRNGGDGARTVLVVEDDPAFAELLAGVARERSFEPRIVGTADEAFAACAEEPPAAVLLDLGLPDHTGLSVLDRLKHEPSTRHIPVHVVSGQSGAEATLGMGAVGALTKPVSREDLLRAFDRLEQRLDTRMKRILVVEDDENQRKALEALLAADDVTSVTVETVAAALDALGKEVFDCVVMDLSLPDGTGFDLLEKLSLRDGSFPPIIVYTGRTLSPEEEQQLSRYSQSIIVKGARSPERLLDEVTLFLHQVESQLPRERQKMLETARSREDAFTGKRILVAEDDVRNVFALSSIFEPKGAKLLIARNGKQALDLLEREPVDLVLMDVMMPEMDGLEAMRRIRQNPKWARVPVIALTAKAMKDDREKCREAGANDYVAKPIDVDKLVSLVRVWLRR